MNNSRKYAEDLVGALKTEHYNTQRDVANSIYNTNWKNLENQYKNLQEKLEAKRQENNRAFAKGLVETAESGYDMARANAQNLANRGLITSGVQDLAQQANTTSKGQQVLSLLNKLNSDTEANIEKLNDATSTMAKEEAKLNANLADTLGDIGASQTNAQMNYNTGLADIAGQKDARDMENELAKMQREAQAAANARSRSGNDGVNAEIEDFYKKQGIIAVLNGIDPITGEEIDWDDRQKANAIQVLFGLSNAKDFIDTYDYNSNLDKTNEDMLFAALEDINKYKEKNSKDLNKAIDKVVRDATGTKLNLAANDEQLEKLHKRDRLIEALMADDYSLLYDLIKGANDNKSSNSTNGNIMTTEKDLMLNSIRSNVDKDLWDKMVKEYNNYMKEKPTLPELNSYKDLDMLFYE